MLTQLINNLTKEQKVQLFARDIPPQTISYWRSGKRRPTYAQAVSLAFVTGADLKELLLEIALEDVHEMDKEAAKAILNS